MTSSTCLPFPPKGGDDLLNRPTPCGAPPPPPHHAAGAAQPPNPPRPAPRGQKPPPNVSWASLAQDLLDPGDRLVDRLLGADALGDDAVDRLRPDPLLPIYIVPPDRPRRWRSRAPAVATRPASPRPCDAGRSGRARTAGRAASVSTAACARRRSRDSASASPRPTRKRTNSLAVATLAPSLKTTAGECCR